MEMTVYDGSAKLHRVVDAGRTYNDSFRRSLSELKRHTLWT